ncbi:MAG: DUF4988 domain-containing protein, partial [Clostridia bacterium]|nr:DUF4988 domain-containing protein [Clostridia bacterium]
LQSQITALSGNVDYLQSLINQGKVVTNVEQNGEGVTISFSDGSTYTIYNGQDGADGKDGVDGKDGNDGKDADVWTIGDDGYWYLNGTKTDYKAIGSDGATGATGAQGEQGIQGEQGEKGDKGDTGADGKSYVLIPNYDTGYFDLYEVIEGTDDNGAATYDYQLVQSNFIAFTGSDDEEEDTTPALTAIWDGNYLHLYNVQVGEDEEGNPIYENVDVFLGSALNGIAVVPSVLDKETFYPTTDAPFLNLTTWYSDAANTEATDDTDAENYYDETSGKWISQYTVKTDEEGEKVYKTDESGNPDEDNPVLVPFATTTSKIVYRLNPGNAYVENALYEFVNRSLKTRSSDVDGDNDDLLDIVSVDHSGESYTVTAKLADGADVSEGSYEFAAFRLWVGSATAADDQTNVYTSDYIRVQGSSDANTVIVNEPASEKTDGVVTFHTRTTSLQYDADNNGTYDPETGATESDEFVQGIVKYQTYNEANEVYAVAADQVDLYVPYCDKDRNPVTTDLADYVNTAAIFNQVVDETTEELTSYSYDYLSNCGVDVTYTYTLLDHYYIYEGLSETEVEALTADDLADYDQQTWITLEGSVVSVPEQDLAFGKHPVVRVDAYYGEKLLASSYIQIEISAPACDPVYIPLKESWLYYRQIDGHYVDATIEAHQTWTLAEFVENVGTASGLDLESLDDIWTYYVQDDYIADLYSVDTGSSSAHIGGANDVYTNITEMEKGDNGSETLKWYSTYGFGWHMYEDVDDDATFFYMGVNDHILTQHTYTTTYVSNCDADGVYYDFAPYVFTLTIQSQNTYVCPNIVITWPFYVADNCLVFDLNTLYKLTNDTTKDDYLAKFGLDEDADAVLAKGRVVDDAFEMSTTITEHFETANIFEDIDDLVEAAGQLNVSGIQFQWAEGTEGVDPSDTQVIDESYNNGDAVVKLTEVMTEPYVIKEMTYSQILDNGELCPHSYYIVFINPFTAGVQYTPAVLTDDPGENTVDVSKCIIVYEDGTKAYYYDKQTDTAAKVSFSSYFGYGSTDVSVKYSIDWDNPDGDFLKTYVDQEKVILDVDESTGVVTWENGGTRLQSSYTFYVDAVITIGDTYQVTCEIPVKLN